MSNKRSALTTRLIAGIPHSLLLQDACGEMHVLVPSLEPTRPALGVWSTALVLKRGATGAAWARALDTMYYLYPAHISLSFLVCPTLASSLYLLLLHFLHRDYARTFKLANSVGVDYAFSDEERNLFRALGHANGDVHPDAHACRLKIASVLDKSASRASPPWDVAVEAHGHATKLSHVSAVCHLTPIEELALLCDRAVDSTAHPEYRRRWSVRGGAYRSTTSLLYTTICERNGTLPPPLHIERPHRGRAPQRLQPHRVPQS